ncbi:MAG: class I SAM-dependent methyltransferase [Bryobacteraceae bacterium]
MKLYGALAEWWPLFSPPDHYREEAAFYVRHLLDAGSIAPRTLLEFGSGGGNNAFHMKRYFHSVTLVDLSPGMLAVSRRLNPDCEHCAGDMRTLRLGRQFDRVFIHDAICYMASAEDLQRAIDTAWIHCRPGGAALFAPDYVRETFQPSTDCGGEDAGARALRYLEWVHPADPHEASFFVDYLVALRHEDGSVTVEQDRHREGLFARGDWLHMLSQTGFEPTVVPFRHSEVEDRTLDVFLAVRPAA